MGEQGCGEFAAEPAGQSCGAVVPDADGEVLSGEFGVVVFAHGVAVVVWG